mmetsp:Transcript_8133/g.8395  ORF Transcript_8133/g.8395 Transcript_8133/m.8395 type:complete len:83 (+) Transcript_8133:33-281(+)
MLFINITSSINYKEIAFKPSIPRKSLSDIFYLFLTSLLFVLLSGLQPSFLFPLSSSPSYLCSFQAFPVSYSSLQCLFLEQGP